MAGTRRQQSQGQGQQMQRQQPPRASNAPRTTSLTLPAEVAEFGIDKPTWLALQNLYPGAQWQSQVMAYEYCRARGLDVLKKPVHIVPMSIRDAATGQYVLQDVILPGITETRITASRTQQYAGQDPAVVGPKITIPVNNQNTSANVVRIEVPEFVTVTVYRLTGGKRFAYSHTEYYLEACARKNDGTINEMWRKRPIGQLTKCAEAGALRKAFSEEIGGEPTAEEMMGQEGLHIEDAIVVGENGPSGIPEPGTKAPQQGEVVDAEFTEDDSTAKPEASKQDAPKDAPKTATPAKAAEPAKDEPPPSGSFTIDLPAGALSIVTAQLKAKGITDQQLLAKLGANVTVANINQALALIKSWGA